MEKVAIFVDVQNIYYTTRQEFGCHFNYREFWADAIQDREVVSAIAYATDRGDAKQLNFQDILREIGFEVKLKPFLKRRDGSTKADWDVGIALDMLELAEQVNVIVLASGDGDFDLAVERVETKYAVKTTVYGVRKLTSESLIKAAEHYVPIQDRFLLT